MRYNASRMVLSSVARFHLRMFLVMGIQFGAVTGLFHGIRTTPADGLRYGLLAGAFFGFFMAFFLGHLHVSGARRRGQPDPNRVRHEVTVCVALAPPDAFERGLAAVRALPNAPRVKETSAPNLIRVGTGMTWESFGERVELRFAPRTDGTTDVVISSRPSFRLTIADYGRNWHNVQTIRAALGITA